MEVIDKKDGKLMKIKPVILGTDINAYGVARSFHQAYGIKSLALGASPLFYTRYSKIVDVRTHDHFADQEEVFLKVLKDLAVEIKDQYDQLILIPCSDGYTSLVSKNQEVLAEDYDFNVVDYDLQRKLENKKDFYSICEKYGLDYPATKIIGPDSYQDPMPDLTYPVALKANDSIEYLYLDFPGKKKAYKIDSPEELHDVLQAIYDAGYHGEMILQDFIPGNSSAMYVLNAYVNRKSQVKMMSLGKCLLDECLPTQIGNYNALVTTGNRELYQQYQDFLEAIGYTGYANFDLKYDVRDGKYKVFEINLRQGRSSFYMDAGGINFITYLVDDLVYQKDKAPCYGYDQGLWLYVAPRVLKKYVDPSDRDLALKLLKEGYTFTQWYKGDRNFRRWLEYMRRRLSTLHYYPKYQPDRANN